MFKKISRDHRHHLVCGNTTIHFCGIKPLQNSIYVKLFSYENNPVSVSVKAAGIGVVVTAAHSHCTNSGAECWYKVATGRGISAPQNCVAYKNNLSTPVYMRQQ